MASNVPWIHTGFKSIAASAHNKRWVSAAASATLNNAQALYLKQDRSAEFAPKIRLAITDLTLFNYSGAAATMGIAVRYALARWGFGTVTAAGVFTDDTTDAQSATTGDITLHDRADEGSGFIIHADEPFNIYSFVQSTAGDQTVPVLLSEYWNGSGWSDNSAAYYTLLTDVLIGSGTGEKVRAFALPQDWAKGGIGAGVRPDRYNLRVTHSFDAAGTADPAASQLFVGKMDLPFMSFSDGSYASILGGNIRFPSSGEALYPVFSTAHALNTVTGYVGEVGTFED
jgi:hypothetical protein